jgi:DNA-binding transcriptional regulator GbsR (MarR family)
MISDPAVIEAELLAADAIGDVIEHWGFRRALGRIWTILYLAGEPLSAAELSERLQMSSGAMSLALTELQRWGVVHRLTRPGERREFFEAESSLWKMISRVINERERHLAHSARERLEEAARRLRAAPQSPGITGAHARVKRLLTLTNIAETMIQNFLSSRFANFSEFGEVLDFRRPASKGRASGSAE